MEKWPIGVFTSIGAGLRSKLKLPMSWVFPTIRCTPLKKKRELLRMQKVSAQLQELALHLPQYSGIEGESYADIQLWSIPLG